MLTVSDGSEDVLGEVVDRRYSAMSLLWRVDDWGELIAPRITAAQKSTRASCCALRKSWPARDQLSLAPTLISISSRAVAVTGALSYRLLVICFPMKRVRLQQWSGSALCPRSRPARSYDLATPLYSLQRCRHQTTASISSSSFGADDVPPSMIQARSESIPQTQTNSSRVRSSAKLAALHARLSLPQKVPLETLARTLIDATAVGQPALNNASLAILGGELLSYYTSEYIIAQYPRLPLAVVFAAMYAYCGPKALAAITREWGVEHAAHPGKEVDPGYLQFQRVPPQPKEQEFKLGPDTVGIEGHGKFRQGISNRAVRSNEFGDVPLRYHSAEAQAQRQEQQDQGSQGVTAEQASTSFVRAVVGAIHLHAGRGAAKQFFKDHFRSRQLNMSSLFQFKYPSKDLTMLCRREGFQPPVARILAETGRKSRHPVFVVGVFSGNDKLGEGAGASLDEAKMRSCVAALKGWYLYSPLEVRVPSDMEEVDAKPWQPILVDSGDVVV